MANPNVKAVTDLDFKKNVLEAKEPVLVDFWAEWCAPCRHLAPTIDELATDFAGKATVAKLDIDANPEIPAQYGIRSIPTVLLFKNGQVVGHLVGRQGKEAYVEVLNQHSD